MPEGSPVFQLLDHVQLPFDLGRPDVMSVTVELEPGSAGSPPPFTVCAEFRYSLMFSSRRVVATTSCPAARSAGINRVPITPDPPARKIRTFPFFRRVGCSLIDFARGIG